MYISDLKNELTTHGYKTELIYENLIPTTLRVYQKDKLLVEINMQKQGYIKFMGMVKPSMINRLIKFSQTEISQRINNADITIELPANDYVRICQMNLKFNHPEKANQTLQLNKDEQFALSHLRRQMQKNKKGPEKK